ncbi:NIPSNAP family protein [Pontiella sulfatireligans]|uniref:NIPSNAP domain-containing protein n=1 Tax=Pontiella sulfatireligans TaxID=2750658 RepID=A0A6C2UTN2_9BACT|nr:NIPSNAP family protein [Pontiella sulfatireligans]VGO22577.1 hypothetical protein SCARR_04662 [Pontiella sulfatireligans]
MINRRNFAAVLAVSATASVKAAAGNPKRGTQFFELRRYLLDDATKQKALEAFFRDVEIPALNRAGIGSVGVFKELEGDSLSLYMLLPFPSLESFVSLTDRLAVDPNYLADGAAILNADKKTAPYLRIESSLMEAFDRLPTLRVPEKKATRVYELRQYESASFTAAQNKIEMFNAGGEIDIFLETGLDPVFFGRSLSGAKLPNLTYMISFDDMAAHDANWDAFKKHPEWNRIKAIPKYKGTVSNITKTFLKATPYSQI